MNYCNDIWKNVLIQCLKDTVIISKRGELIKAKMEAIDYFNIKNKHYINTCIKAGYNPEWFLKRIEKFSKHKKLINILHRETLIKLIEKN